MGIILNQVSCIYHSDSSPSLALYEDGTYWCFGCQRYGRWVGNPELECFATKKVTKQHRPKKILDETKFNSLVTLPEFLVKRNVSLNVAQRYGVKINNEGNLYLPIYDINGKYTGSQLRNTNGSAEKKIINYAGLGGYPTYGVVRLSERADSWFIVESVLDGLSLASTLNVNSLVLLGTRVSPDADLVLRTLISPRIFLDPDARFKALAVRDKYRLLGVKLDVVISEKKPYEVTSENDFSVL